MKGKRILITGCAGSIGSELCRQLSKHNKVFGIDINESGFFDIQQETGIFGRVGDIRDEKTVWDIFSDFKPQIIYHSAAYKHVPLMEKYPIEAIQTNILGTWNVIKEAKNWECLEKFVMISTDKAVSSTSIMGASKRMCEIMVKNQGKGFVVVRFGNVMGSRGSLLTIWQRQIDAGQKLTITDDRMERYFMTIEEACNLVIQAGEMGAGGEIICLEMGKKVNIKELAFDILQKAGKKPEVDIIGIREGETITEELMFEEEKLLAKKVGNFYIIK
jgi:FlaA1/EpsC-like NDP-sugar epimerase